MGTRTFVYNDALQLESESIDGRAGGLYTKTVTRTYEDSGVKGRPTGFKLGTEYTVTYGHDASNGRFSSVSWNAGAKNGVVNYSYVPNSDLLAGYSSDSNIGVSYTYETRRNLKTAVENTYGMSVISRYAYRYDELGRRTDVVNTGTAFANDALSKYGYNDRSEVVSSERYAGTDPDAPGTAVTDENRSFEYDPIGNRKESVAGAQQAAIYETNVLNQYTNISGAETASPAYDDDGNMTAYKDKSCTWNAENRLVSVETAAKKVDFLYDYMGRRVRKQVYAGSPGSWSLESEKQFVYDGWNLVKEIAVSGGGSGKYFVWGPDLSQSLQGAGGIGGLVCVVDNGKSYYYFYDGNGNVGQVVDDAGVIAAHYEYDAFGKTVAQSGAYADENAFRFSTKYFDTESGFYYYGFRYYALELGQWINRDPTGEKGGENLSAFVFNSPIIYFDALGLEPILRLDFDEYGNINPEGTEWEYSYPGEPGTGYSLEDFHYITNNNPDLYDDFDKRFLTALKYATKIYPFGNLTELELNEAIVRGYVEKWDYPLISCFDKHGWNVGKTGKDAIIEAAFSIMTAAYFGVIFSEGEATISSGKIYPNAPLGRPVPQGFTRDQFRSFIRNSNLLAKQHKLPNGQLLVHGSRASGTSHLGSDIDVIMRVDAETFNAYGERLLCCLRKGTKLYKQVEQAIRSGKLSRHRIGKDFNINGVQAQLEPVAGMKVDYSVIRIGSKWDKGPFVDLGM